ncbi:hypothetical protein LIER_30411 [Lithospermum erythrorhizon]|uniref:Reverse transcriptase RNase H-like domain-containing protein n=1 Tax=Lithospermum erythrorhizon TaxID=34254 RepID=A0AAV3RPT0_LITER
MLTSAPIMQPLDWNLSFEIMCDASDYDIGTVFGKTKYKKPYVIYYARKTLNSAQMNYSTTRKELLAVVFALEKFRSYLVGSPIVVFIDHSALKYLLAKKDAKPSAWKLAKYFALSRPTVSNRWQPQLEGKVYLSKKILFSFIKKISVQMIWLMEKALLGDQARRYTRLK